MSVSSQSRPKQTICGFRRWSPCTTSLRCMSQLLALSGRGDTQSSKFELVINATWVDVAVRLH
jgi:hypothetical protein